MYVAPIEFAAVRHWFLNETSKFHHLCFFLAGNGELCAYWRSGEWLIPVLEASQERLDNEGKSESPDITEVRKQVNLIHQYWIDYSSLEVLKLKLQLQVEPLYLPIRGYADIWA